MVVLEALKAVELEETTLNHQMELEKLVLEKKVRPILSYSTIES